MHMRTEPCPRMLTYRPPRIALTLLLTAVALQLVLPATLPALPAAPSAGVVVAALGFGIMTRAWWLFRLVNTAICPTANTTTLITGDVYRVSRNPMYLGILLMLLGVAIGVGGLPFYLAALLFFLVIDFTFCPYEERKLEESFGRRFITYCKVVRRWL